MVARLWNLLHDGVVERVEGAVPGDLEIEVSARYLRAMFTGEGEGFVLHLQGCSLFEFTPWDSPAMTGAPEIVNLRIQFVSAQEGDPLSVCSVEGMLRVRYGSASLRLDSGAAVSVEDLEAAATRYWSRFEARRRGASDAG